MGGDLVCCPFDKTHWVDPLRMPQHLLKCRKNYKGEALATCEYNALHLVRPDEMEEHYKHCIDFIRVVKRDGNDDFRENTSGSRV